MRERQSETDQNRLLSFQWSILSRDRERTGISYYPDGARPKSSDLIQHILGDARSGGMYSHYPKRLYLVCHFTLAELAILSDFEKLKSRFDAIRSSFTTLIEPFEITITDHNRNQRKIEIHLRDSLHLTPQGAKLRCWGKFTACRRSSYPPELLRTWRNFSGAIRTCLTDTQSPTRGLRLSTPLRWRG